MKLDYVFCHSPVSRYRMHSGTKTPILTTLPDGSINPNCYACKIGYVILTSTGKISPDSLAVKKKQLLIKKNGQVDNRSAICKTTLDNFQNTPDHQFLLQGLQSSATITQDSTESSTSGMRSAQLSQPKQPVSVISDRKATPQMQNITPTQQPSLPSAYTPSTTVSMQGPVMPIPPQGDIMVPTPLHQPQFQPVGKTANFMPRFTQPVAPLRPQMPLQPQPQVQHQPQFVPLTYPAEKLVMQRPPSFKADQRMGGESSVYSPMGLYQRASIQRVYDFARPLYFVPDNLVYFTDKFIAMLQRFFRRPIDSEEEIIIGLQPLYNVLGPDAKDILNRNLPGCEKEIVSRLLDDSIKLLSPSALSVISVIDKALTSTNLNTNVCQTLHQLSKHIKSALA